MKVSLIALALCLCSAVPAFAADVDPCMLGNGTTTPTHGGFPKTVLSADFDGDGVEDRACALLADLDADGPVNIDVEFGPFDKAGYPTDVTTLEEYKSPKDFGDRALSIMEPGRYDSLCLKGYGDGCKYGEETQVYTARPSVSMGTEGASWMYVYIGRSPTDKKKRLFRTFGLSD